MPINYTCCFCSKPIIPEKGMNAQANLLQIKKLRAVEFVNEGFQFKGSGIIERSFYVCPVCTVGITILARTKGLRQIATKLIEEEDKARGPPQTNKYRVRI